MSAQGAVISRSDIEITGEDNLTAYRTTPRFEYRFCSRCGSRLFAYELSDPDLMYFMPATLDGGVHPGHPTDKECHVHVGSKAVWENIGDDLLQYLAASPDEI